MKFQLIYLAQDKAITGSKLESTLRSPLTMSSNTAGPAPSTFTAITSDKAGTKQDVYTVYFKENGTDGITVTSINAWGSKASQLGPDDKKSLVDYVTVHGTVHPLNKLGSMIVMKDDSPGYTFTPSGAGGGGGNAEVGPVQLESINAAEPMMSGALAEVSDSEA